MTGAKWITPSMVILLIAWHAGLLVAVKFTERWIEFTRWYYISAVYAPPLVLALLSVPLLCGRIVSWKETSLLLLGGVALSMLHRQLIHAAAASV